MARESQGLQVLLIVFVMLTVVLGVSLYLYVKKADEATKAVAAAKRARQQAEQRQESDGEERNVLKTLIGLPERSTDGNQEAVRRGHADLRQREEVGRRQGGRRQAAFDAGTLYYTRLLAGHEQGHPGPYRRNLSARGTHMADLQAQFKNREAAKDDAIDALTAGYGKLDDQVKKYHQAISATELQATADESQRICRRRWTRSRANHPGRSQG